MDRRVLEKLPITGDVSVEGKYKDFSIPAVQDLHFSHELVHWSGKMERAMERIHEWHSCGQMEASSANYSPVQLIPMVTHMKGRALWSSSCPSLYPSFYMEMFSIFMSFPPEMEKRCPHLMRLLRWSVKKQNLAIISGGMT